MKNFSEEIDLAYKFLVSVSKFPQQMSGIHLSKEIFFWKM